MNERLLRRMRRLEWSIVFAQGNDDVAVLEWQMSGRPRLGPSFHVDGMTRVRARDGKVVEHRDYWDLAELASSMAPFGPRLLRAVLSPVA